MNQKLDGAKMTGSKGGRPTDYDPSYCESVIEWGAQGKSKTWMAAEIGVSKQTLLNWEERHPEFFDAITRAMALSQQWWEDAGQTGMTADKFNSSVWSRSMAARFPDDWRENKGLEVTAPPETRTHEQLDAEINRLLAKAAGHYGYMPIPGFEERKTWET